MTTSTSRAAALLALKGRLLAEARLPARDAAYSPIPPWLREDVRACLGKAGIERLYTHQAAALEAWRSGEDVVLTSGTGSGKSMAYALPAAQACLAEPFARALLVYPTKALAQDQAAKLEALLPKTLRIAVYDGDTPPSRRAAIRKEAHVVLTNPDMLHSGILPATTAWAKFLAGLRLVALDEAHAYRGGFGSHVGYVLRRLLRRCAAQRSEPRVVMASATLADPANLAASLAGRPFRSVSDDSGPRGARTLLCVQTGDQDPSPSTTTARLLAGLAGAGARTLAFSRSRPAAELVARLAQDALGGPQVEAYRAGYTPADRRAIERRFFSGELVGLSSTSAMELGVDVGDLDCVVVNGYPGSAARFWQQAGRTGRAGRDGLVVYVAHADALENWLAAEPERLVGAPPEPAVLRLENPYVAEAQTRCAAWELPPSREELAQVGPGAEAAAAALVERGEASWSAGRLFVVAGGSPARSISLRGSGAGRVALLCDGQTVGEMERWRAAREAHPGAVHLHQAATYLVRSLDLEAGVAGLERADLPYYTRSYAQSLAVPTVEIARDGPLELGGLKVVTAVAGFRKYALETQQVLDDVPLDLPPEELDTLGLRFDLSALAGLADGAAAHALEHALAAAAPVAAGLDRSDLESTWAVACPQTLSPVVWLYDPLQGGSGASEAAFDSRQRLVELAHALLAGCPCLAGCPRCLLSPHCECGNEGLDKPGALRLLTALRSPSP